MVSKRYQRPKVYLSGPMRGKPDFNYAAFNEATTDLRKAYDVFNPAESFDGRTDLAWETYMRADIEAVLKSDMVVVLDGWENSAGCRVELSVAVAVGLPIYTYRYNSPLAELDVSWIVQPAASKGKPAPEADQETVLQRANRIVYGARQQDYGHPHTDFSRTAQFWAAILGTEVSPEQVALCMMALKISRLCNTPGHYDSIVDVAGYAGTYELVWNKRQLLEGQLDAEKAEVAKGLVENGNIA